MVPLAMVVVDPPKVVPVVGLFGRTLPEVERRLGESAEQGRGRFMGKPSISVRFLRTELNAVFVGGRMVSLSRYFSPLPPFVGWAAALQSLGYSTVGVKARHEPTPDREVWRMTGGSLPKGYVARWVYQLTQTKPSAPVITITAPL